MGQKILVVIDLQNDFINGALGTEEAQKILPKCQEKIQNHPGEVIFTQDTHDENYLSSQEGRNLPTVHCINGSWGWQLAPEIEKIQQECNYRIFQKPTFASTDLAQYLYRINQEKPITEIEFIGLCTDICVVSNALMVKGHLPEVPIKIDPACCAGSTPAAHEAALCTLQSCQITISA